MAKNTDIIASGFVEVETLPAEPNKYLDTVRDWIENNADKAYRLVVTTSEVTGKKADGSDRVKNVAQAEKLEFQNAANELGKTARIFGKPTVDEATNQTAFIFVLKEKYNKPKLGPRKPKNGADGAVEVNPDNA